MTRCGGDMPDGSRGKGLAKFINASVKNGALSLGFPHEY